MGDWGYRAWENDEAADWFHVFWRDGFGVLIDEIRRFDPKAERYDRLRAAAYILEALGNPYIWPSAHLGALPSLIDETVAILGHMIAPPNKDWVFLDIWGSEPGIIAAVEAQIEALRRRRGDIVR